MKPAAGMVKSSRIEWGLAMLLGGLVLGFGLRSQWAYLWWRWTSSGLRSIGILLPLASLALLWRAWKGTAPGRGSLWGLAALLAALAGARWLRLPSGVLIWTAASGAVVWLRGWHDWRRAWFGLGLLLFLNPVPMFLTSMFDTRLQLWAVALAQAFASLLGMQPVRYGFSLRFAHHQSMYLAGQCEGLRSAVTMFYLCLITAYWRGLRRLRLAAFTLAGVLLAYLINALRLSGLVIFHLWAGHWPALSGYESVADHAWGGLLFFLGATGLWLVLLRSQPVDKSAGAASRLARGAP